MKTLIIVESPTKANTIKNLIPKDYEVVASVGHIRDLDKWQGWLRGVNIEKISNQTTSRLNTKLLNKFKNKLKQKVLIANDPDM